MDGDVGASGVEVVAEGAADDFTGTVGFLHSDDFGTGVFDDFDDLLGTEFFTVFAAAVPDVPVHDFELGGLLGGGGEDQG